MTENRRTQFWSKHFAYQDVQPGDDFRHQHPQYLVDPKVHARRRQSTGGSTSTAIPSHRVQRPGALPPPSPASYPNAITRLHLPLASFCAGWSLPVAGENGSGGRGAAAEPPKRGGGEGSRRLRYGDHHDFARVLHIRLRYGDTLAGRVRWDPISNFFLGKLVIYPKVYQPWIFYLKLSLPW